MNSLYRLAAFLCFLVPGPAALAADDYRILDTTVTHPAPEISRTQRLIQIGADPLNQINLTRIRRSGDLPGRDHPVLLMAPTGFTVAFYETTSTGRYDNSWVGRLAKSGFDVWVLDDRTSRDLAPGTCDGGTVDCSIMQAWDLAARVADSEFALKLIAARHRREKPIVGGFVGGSIAAIAALNAHPDAYSGLLAWQGVTFTNDPRLRAYNEPFCQALEGALAQGVYFDNSTAGLLPLIQGAIQTPDALAPPLPGLPPGLTYRQIVVLLMSVHTDSPQHPTPEWISAVGNYQTGTFQFADWDIVVQFLHQLTLFQPTAMFRDMLCGIARGEMKHLSNVGRFRGHAFFLGTDLAMAPLVPDTAALFTRAASVKTQLESGIGETDPLWMPDWDRIVMYDRPITRWMRKVFEEDAGRSRIRAE